MSFQVLLLVAIEMIFFPLNVFFVSLNFLCRLLTLINITIFTQFSALTLWPSLISLPLLITYQIPSILSLEMALKTHTYQPSSNQNLLEF